MQVKKSGSVSLILQSYSFQLEEGTVHHVCE